MRRFFSCPSITAVLARTTAKNSATQTPNNSGANSMLLDAFWRNVRIEDAIDSFENVNQALKKDEKDNPDVNHSVNIANNQKKIEELKRALDTGDQTKQTGLRPRRG